MGFYERIAKIGPPGERRAEEKASRMHVEYFSKEEREARNLNVVRRDPPRRSDLSEDQVEVYDTLYEWVDMYHPRDQRYITLGGLAGTGKTTLIASLAKEWSGRSIVFAAYTGKAVDVLRAKLQAYGINAPCMTLHSLLYQPVIDSKTGEVLDWELKSRLGESFDDHFEAYEIVVIDEASMVGTDLWRDLVSFGVPIIAVGDHGQLPPVGNQTTSLMLEPDLKLEKIHRQAADNPIIALAHFVREGGNVRLFKAPGDDTRVRRIARFSQAVDVVAHGGLDTAGICYFNSTRVRLNDMARERRGYEGPDTVICLKNQDKILFNGMRGQLVEVISEPDERQRFVICVEFPDAGFRVRGMAYAPQFGASKTIASISDLPGITHWSQLGMLFDYGYVLTCHKSQGSQWREVVIQYETLSKDTEATRRAWLYTAITRAVERVHLVA